MTRELFLACRDEAKCARRPRSRIRAAHDAGDVRPLFASQGGRCFVCGKARDFAELRTITIDTSWAKADGKRWEPARALRRVG